MLLRNIFLLCLLILTLPHLNAQPNKKAATLNKITLTPIPEVANRTINCLLMEGDSVLWIGTPEGLIKVNTRKTPFQYQEVLFENLQINALAIDGLGNKYIGTYKAELYRFNTKGDTIAIDIEGFERREGEMITSIAASKNEVYFATNNGQLYAHTPSRHKSTEITPPKELREGNQDIYSIYISRSNEKILCTPVGVFSHDKYIVDVKKPDKLKWKAHKNVLSEAFQVAQFNKIKGFWLIGRNHERESNLVSVKDGKWEEKTLECVQSSNKYQKFERFTTNNKNHIWIVSQSNLIKYDIIYGTSVLHSTEKEDTSKLLFATSIACINDSITFIGTKGHGLLKVSPPEKEKEKEEGLKVDFESCGRMIGLPNIQFDVNEHISYKNVAKALSDIDKVVQFLKKNTEATVEIHGHSDLVKGIGENKRAKTLSENRIAKVKKDLIRYGIDEKRIETIAHGDKHTIVQGGSSLNRRVEIQINCPVEKKNKMNKQSENHLISPMLPDSEHK